MKIIHRISLIALFIFLNCFIYAKQNNMIQIYSNKHTDILVWKNSNSYELLGYGGSINNSADAVFLAKCIIDENTLIGYLYSVDTDIVSYEIEDNKKYKFLGHFTLHTLNIVTADVLEFAGINTIFEGTYKQIVNDTIYEKKRQGFIDLLKGTKIHTNILNSLLLEEHTDNYTAPKKEDAINFTAIKKKEK